MYQCFLRTEFFAENRISVALGLTQVVLPVAHYFGVEKDITAKIEEKAGFGAEEEEEEEQQQQKEENRHREEFELSEHKLFGIFRRVVDKKCFEGITMTVQDIVPVFYVAIYLQGPVLLKE